MITPSTDASVTADVLPFPPRAKAPSGVPTRNGTRAKATAETAVKAAKC